MKRLTEKENNTMLLLNHDQFCKLEKIIHTVAHVISPHVAMFIAMLFVLIINKSSTLFKPIRI